MDKRTFIKTGIITGASLLLPGHIFSVKSETQEEFKQVDLSYQFADLEPYIDAETMELHYSKHHAGYTKKFNAAIKQEGLTTISLREIFAKISKYSPSVRNNGGGYYNHNLYWKVLSPDGGGLPKGKFLRKLESDFGSFELFREEFSKAATTVFGSGWAWLINQKGKLKIIQTPNQDNPLMDISDEKGFPLLAVDVWEHAYYLKYQNKRAAYIEAIWNIINWDYVSERFEKSMGK